MTALAALEPQGTTREHDAVEAGPTHDLLHGIQAAGYPLAWVEEQLGHGVPDWATYVPRAVADRVARLADWCGARYPGPCQLTRQLASAHGWTVDLLYGEYDDVEPDPDYVDDPAVRRVATGNNWGQEYPRLNDAELRAAVTAALAAGTPPYVVGERARVNGTRIRQVVAEVRNEQAPPGRGPLPPLEPDPKWVRAGRPRTPGRRGLAEIPDVPFGHAPAGYCTGCGEDIGLRLKDGTPGGRTRWHSDCARRFRAGTKSSDRSPTRAQAATRRAP